MQHLDCPTGRLSWFDSAPDRSGGPIVMMLHSSAGSGRQWRRLAERLAPRWRVLLPDLIGYGATPMTGPSPTLADELALLTQLASRIDGPFHIVGHSYGAALGLELARLMPDRVLSMALYEPVSFAMLRPAGQQEAWQEIEALARSLIALADAGKMDAVAAMFLDYWIGKGALATMPPELQQYIVGCMGKVAAEWRDLFRHERSNDHFAALKMPILLMHGGKTTLAARTVAETLRPMLSDLSWKMLPGLSHMAPVSQPDQVNPLFEDFLAGMVDRQHKPAA